MVSTQTQKILRNAYYIGILALVLNTLTATNSFIKPLFSWVPFGGLQLAEIVAIGTVIGAFFAYKRKVI